MGVRHRVLTALSISAVYLVALIVVVSLWVTEVNSWEAPDTTFKCRPGETYTIKECP